MLERVVVIGFKLHHSRYASHGNVLSRDRRGTAMES
jgi:hypothetical protein